MIWKQKQKLPIAISQISQQNFPWNESWKGNFLGIDFRQID